MKRRCMNPRNAAYRNYGAIGIRVAPEWVASFSRFIADVGRRPPGKVGRYPKYTLDRINNAGNYEPGNVRWATREEQANNTRQNHYVEYRGERKTVTAWCKELGLDHNRIAQRIWYGWSVERAFEEPVHPINSWKNRKAS